jgi:hypothetical protein
MQTFVTFSLYLATSNKTYQASIQTVLMLPIYQGEAIAQVSLHMVLKPKIMQLTATIGPAVYLTR